MKTHRQETADLFRRLGDLRHNPGGRKRDATARQSNPLAVHSDFHRIAHIVEVVERFAHSHQNDVGEQSWRCVRRTRTRLWPFIQIVPRNHNLPDDFTRRQIAHELLCARVTEGASQGTAHLRADTQRPTVRLRDINHLYFMTARNFDKVFARAIIGHLLRDNFRHLNHKMRLKLGPKRFGEIGHHVKVALAPLVDPLPDLVEAHLELLFRRANARKLRFEGLTRKPNNIDPPRIILRYFARYGEHVWRNGCVVCHRSCPLGLGSHIAFARQSKTPPRQFGRKGLFAE